MEILGASIKDNGNGHFPVNLQWQELQSLVCADESHFPLSRCTQNRERWCSELAANTTDAQRIANQEQKKKDGKRLFLIDQ